MLSLLMYCLKHYKVVCEFADITKQSGEVQPDFLTGDQNQVGQTTCTSSSSSNSQSSTSAPELIAVIVQGESLAAANEASSDDTLTSAVRAVSATPSTLLGYSVPNHPSDATDIPTHEVLVKGKKKVLHFQCSWFQRFPWLHYSPEVKAAMCFYCAKAHSMSLLSLCTQNETTFIETGFTKWKHALEVFAGHQKSACHSHAVSQLSQMKAASVISQLSAQKQAEQENARKCLVKVVTSIRYLARQGLAFRGHQEENGNFLQLVQLRADDTSDPSFKAYLDRITNFTSHECQNEILLMLSHSVIRSLVNTIKQESVYFAVVVDGTQDFSGKEQESICLRYVDKDLCINESFVGLFEPPDTTGKTLALVLKDVLIRLDLPLTHLRAQTYDGAANMAGEFNGCQRLIRDEQPLALYYHCSAHCVNLVAEHTAACTPLVRDALQQVQELGKLSGRSLKFRNIFAQNANGGCDDSTDDSRNSLISFSERHVTAIKPLCPTRWLCRVSPVSRVIDLYGIVLSSLEAMALLDSETAAKCNGLLEQFRKGVTLLGLKIALAVFSILEQLNRSLQAENATVSGMIKAVESVITQLGLLRSEDSFSSIIDDVNREIAEHDLYELRIPRIRRPPARYSGPSEAHISETVEEHYRAAFYAVIDSAIMQLRERFSTDDSKTGLRTYLQLEGTLLSGCVSDVCYSYPELKEHDNSLETQLKMFRNQYKYNSLLDAQKIMKDMCSEVRALFPAVEKLIRLLLLCPAASCSAERSFSALRRLKTWLRSTMTQQRLNAISICHTHQDMLDNVNVQEIAREFAARSDIRRNVFGNWV